MIIKFEDINNSNHSPLFIGTRPRLASATAVKLLDAERLISVNFVGQRMYLVRYDLAHGTHQIESCIPTQYGGEEVCVDLIDFNGTDLIVTSNCYHDSVSLYQFVDDQISHMQDIPIRDTGAKYCHGARFVPGVADTICATCTMGDKNIYFISVLTTEIMYQFGHDQWKPHDVCFLDAQRMIVLYEQGKPTREANTPYEAKASLVAFDLANGVHEFISEIIFPEAHMDCCQFHAGKLYMNNQMRDTVSSASWWGIKYLLSVKSLAYEGFPHGVDVLPGVNLLAVTNYGDNTIILTQL